MKQGSKVVCIDDSRDERSINTHKFWVTEGEIYTVRSVEGSLSAETRVLLEEIKNPSLYFPELGGYAEPGFAGRRFMPYEDYVLGNVMENEKIEELSLVD